MFFKSRHSILPLCVATMIGSAFLLAPRVEAKRTPQKTKATNAQKSRGKHVAAKKSGKSAAKNGAQFVDGVAILSGSGELSRPEPRVVTALANVNTQARFDAKRNVSVRASTTSSTRSSAQVNAGRNWRTHAEAAANFFNDLETASNDKTGETAVFPPSFQTLDSAGNSINLDQYRGKIVLLDFWATWCPPSRAETPQMVPLYNKYRASGFEIIGISLDTNRARFDAFVQKNNLSWRQIFGGKNWESDLAVMYGIDSIPQTVLLDRDGSIIAIGLRAEMLNEAVKIVMAGR